MAQGDIIGGQVVGGQPFFPCGPCLTPPYECCPYPYPWDADGNLLYSHDDLPDTIVLTNGSGPHTLTKDATRFGFTDGTDFVSAIYEPGGFWWITSGNWYGEVGSVGVGNTSCLIDITTMPYDTIEDEFLDTYTVTFTGSGGSFDATVTRSDLCTWTGTTANGSAVSIFFIDWCVTETTAAPNCITWQVVAFFGETGIDPDATTFGAGGFDGYKQCNGTADYHADTPVGGYGYCAPSPPPGDGAGGGRTVTVS